MDLAVATKLEYDGYPCRYMTPENLLAQELGQAVYYVWPYEGGINAKGKWEFHKGTVMDGNTELEAPTKPLLVDAASARAFQLVYNAINDKNKEKTRGFLLSRGLTCWMFDTLIWPNVSFGRK